MSTIYSCDICKASESPPASSMPKGWNYITVTSGNYFRAFWHICPNCSEKFKFEPATRTAETDMLEAIREIIQEEIDNQ